MLCSRCSKDEATVFFKQILHNEVTELHLCAACSKGAGVSPVPGSPSLDMLFGNSAAAGKAGGAACPECGTDYGRFRETGTLGCPACYDALARPLAEVLETVHGSQRHAGKFPARPEEDLRRLQRLLDAAVKAENFEEAARLRDRLRSLQG